MSEVGREDHKELLYQQDTELEFLSILLPFLREKTFIDIGAEKGSFSRFLTSVGLKGVIVEPLHKFRDSLQELAHKNDCVFLPYAIHDKDDNADFYSAFDLEGQPQDQFSSLHPLNNDDRLHHKKTASVTCRSLNSLFHEGVIDQRIGVLKIDTEGNDLKILKGMTEIQPEILMCEFFMPGIYHGWEMGHPCGLIAEAKKLGFQHFIAIKRFDVYEMCSLNNEAFIDRQWGNLIFLSNSMYQATKKQLLTLLADKETHFSRGVLANTQSLRKTLAMIKEMNPFINPVLEVGVKNVAINNDCDLNSNLEGLLSKYFALNYFKIKQDNDKRFEELTHQINEGLYIVKIFNPYVIKRKFIQSFRPLLGVLFQHTPKPIIIPKRYHFTKRLKNTPKISIVTPSYNQGDFLERTLLSVLNQNYPALEYMVQDGGSKDQSTEIIHRYKDSLKHWESAKDKGQANAINLGFRHATGDIMAYLNSDDILLPGALRYIARYFNQHPEVDVIYGHRIVVNEDDQEVGRWVLPKHCDEVIRWADFIPQETLFWRRSIWEKVGGLIDESFNFALDWDLIVRFQEAGAKFVRLPRFLGGFRVHAKQKTLTIHDVGEKEVDRIRQRSFGAPMTHSEINLKIKPYLDKHAILNKLYKFGILRY